MNSLLMLVSLFYLAGTFWYYELDWKNKRIVFVVPSEVLYFMATALMIVFFYFVYWGKVVLVYSGYLYVYLFTAFLLFSVLLHMLAKYYEDRRRFRGVKKSWRDEVHNLHGYVSHNMIYTSLVGVLVSFASLEMNGKVEVSGSYDVHIVLFSSFIFGLSFYRTIVHGRLWRTQLVVIPVVTLLLVYGLLTLDSNIWSLPFSLFTVAMLAMSFIMLACDEVFMRRFK